MRPGDPFRVFKGCTKCGLRIRSVCSWGVQNAACRYVRCVSFTLRCPAPSVLHRMDRSERSTTFLIDVYFYGRSSEHNFVVCLTQRYRQTSGLFPCHLLVSVSVIWRSSTPYSGLMLISSGRFALLPSSDEASNRK